MKTFLLILKNIFKALVLPKPRSDVDRRKHSIVNNHHGLYGKDINGYEDEILYCESCDMAAHMHTIGNNDCHLCGGVTVVKDGVWIKGLQRWRIV